MDLLTFSRELPESFTDEEFVGLLGKVIDLEAVQDLPTIQRQALHDVAQYLNDYLILIAECRGEIKFEQGSPMLSYRGPFIANVLTRPGGMPLDHERLETFGVGGAEKYFE